MSSSDEEKKSDSRASHYFDFDKSLSELFEVCGIKISNGTGKIFNYLIVFLIRLKINIIFNYLDSLLFQGCWGLFL